MKGNDVNIAPARYTLAVLSLAGLAAFPLTSLAAFSPADAATIQTALAGKAVVEAALVPRGFAKVAEAKGDLNGDGTGDVALIVRRDVKKKEGEGRRPRPRRPGPRRPTAIVSVPTPRSNLGSSHSSDKARRSPAA